MASLTMMAASFLGPAGAAVGRRRAPPLVVKAAAGNDGQGVAPRDGPSGRRAVVLAVAAAVISAGAASKAVAEEGVPKRGTPEAKKKYAPICVTMPTASVCHK